MLNTNLLGLKATTLKSLLRLVHTSINRSLHTPATAKRHQCLCRQFRYKNGPSTELRGKLRLYSAQSDRHRQKVVIEAAPKIVLDKTERREKLVPVEKTIDVRLSALWKEKIDPYIKLARWDRPIGKLTID